MEDRLSSSKPNQTKTVDSEQYEIKQQNLSVIKVTVSCETLIEEY